MQKFLALILAITAVVGSVWFLTVDGGDRENSTDAAIGQSTDRMNPAQSNHSDRSTTSKRDESNNQVDSAAELPVAALRPNLSSETIYNTDYLSYDKETLAKIAESGDLIGLHMASLRSDYFSLDERERYVLAAAKQGELSGFVRLFFDYLPDASSENAGDFVKAYGYALAAQRLNAPSADEIDMSGIQKLTDTDVDRAYRFAEELLHDLDARVRE